MRITLRDVSKRFGTSTAVDGLSLEIAPGELVALVGGSGCGKTTTLRLVAGFERPDAGEVRFDDRVVNDVPPARRGVGIVFQSYALFPTMTVADNIAFGLRVARWPRARIRDRVAELLALMRLDGLGGRYANQLGRPAAARGPGARARAAAGDLAARRAALRARRQDPAAAARRDPQAPAGPRHHDALRDARPGGGALARRSAGRDAAGASS